MAASLRILAGMRSGPAALLVSIFCSNFITRNSETVSSGMSG